MEHSIKSQAERTSARTSASVFQLDGVPRFTQALPLALQHVVAMIVGCVTPAIIVAGVSGLDPANRVILIQSALIVSALSTFIQLFPLRLPGGFALGSGLPMIMGVSFAYVASMQAIAADFGVAAIFGAQIFGGIIAAIIGFFIDKIRKVFPPLVTGTVVFTIGLSLYPTAINYMAGGASSPAYGHWTNWLVAFLTLGVVTFLNHYTSGFLKLSSILIGIVVGYILGALFGMVDLTAVAEARWFQMPQILHFGITFEPSSCAALGLLFAINAIQAIGDFTATTTGSMEREPANRELRGGIVGYGISNIFSAFLGGLPTASYSQNVGIVTTTKVINRMVLGMAAAILLLAGLAPKFSAVLTTIPQCVLGGATISVFASIAMTGMKLITSEQMDYRNMSVVGLAVAIGVGVTQASASLAQFPAWVTTVFGKSPVVIATIAAVFLNTVLPRQNRHPATVKMSDNSA